MFYAYNYFNIFSAPLFCYFALGKGPLYVVMAFALAFVIHPTFDYLSNKYFKNLTLKMNRESRSIFFYDIPLYLSVPFQMILVVTAFSKVNGNFVEAICAGALCGLSGGILGIASSHELTHRAKKWQKNYGMAMLFTINYPHFAIEHLLHHKTVATMDDPDTARRDESIYQFMLRTIPEGLTKCWEREKNRSLKRTGKTISLKNEMVALGIITLTILGSLLYFGGGAILLVYLVQGLVTIMLLKWINYVEHYGLVRKVINGKTEQVGDKHSWDSLTAMTNFSLFNLGFHSQHHIRPSVEYHQLPKTKDSWNELPSGYSAMMMLALLPGKWKQVMNRQLDLLN